jgi:hypothetical protein
MDMTTALDYSEDYSDPKADIYIDPTAEMVIVRFVSFPMAKNAQIDPTSLPAYQAVAEYLMKE